MPSSPRLLAWPLLLALACAAGCVPLKHPAERRDYDDPEPNEPTVAKRGQWTLIARAELDFASERVTVQVRQGFGELRRLMFRVRGRGLELGDLRITFVDGTVLQREVRERIPAGGQSTAVDLGAEPREVREVELVYRRGDDPGPQPPQGPAVLKLYGKP